LFKNFDATGLNWAINQAMAFYNLPQKVKAGQIERIMQKSAARFTHANTAFEYIKLYEKMLQRPLVNKESDPACRDDSLEDS
jgi:starch synthase/alpha-amylase